MELIPREFKYIINLKILTLLFIYHIKPEYNSLYTCYRSFYKIQECNNYKSRKQYYPLIRKLFFFLKNQNVTFWKVKRVFVPITQNIIMTILSKKMKKLSWIQYTLMNIRCRSTNFTFSVYCILKSMFDRREKRKEWQEYGD